jgi:hypothetical protein
MQQAKSYNRANMMRWILSLILLAFLQPRISHGYASFAGYGYNSCLTCHFNPQGNGPLNDYGRAVSAVAISARPPFLPERITDDELGEASGFFGPFLQLPSWLRLSADFRGLGLYNGTTYRFIPMQLEGSLILKTPRNAFYGVVTAGYIPAPAAYSEERRRTVPVFISREHYVAWRPTSWFLLQGGMMDSPFGIRLAEHTAFSRSKTGLNQNDQAHTLLVMFPTRILEASVYATVGNLYQSPPLRQQGGGMHLDFKLNESTTVGASGMWTRNDYRERQMISLNSRIGAGKGSTVVFDTGLVRSAPYSAAATLGHYGVLQHSLALFRGFHLLSMLEYWAENAFGSSVRTVRFSPGIQYFLLQRLELRLDFSASRDFGSTEVNSDVLQLMPQVHIWL